MMYNRNRNIKHNTCTQSVEYLHSEEVTEIIERMPLGWTKLIVSIVSAMIVILIVLSFIIQYPDTIAGQIKIAGNLSPVRLVTTSAGRIHLLVPNNSIVQKGVHLGYLETGIVYKDIIELEEVCNNFIEYNNEIQLPKRLKLGALSLYYNDFVLAYTQYHQLSKSKKYENIKHALITQQEAEKMVSVNLECKLNLLHNINLNIYKRFISDSILYSSGLISEEEFSKTHNAFLSNQQSKLETLSSNLAKKAEIKAIDLELTKVNINREEELESAYISMISSYNVLMAQINQWKENNLFIAPISGTLQYLDFLQENMFVETAKEVFSVTPHNNTIIGEMQIPIQGAGKVKVGQDVVVKISDYPYNEYGYIRGKINSISSLSRSIHSANGNNYVYLAMVTFPEGKKTNYGKYLPLNDETLGIANIVCAKKKLIQRLFDNLRSVETK